MSDTEHNAHNNHRLHHWLLGATAVVGAISLAPYVLPALGVGQADDVSNMMHFIGSPTDKNMFGSGLAGTLQNGFSHIPLIGGALTSTTPLNIFGLSITSGALASIALSGFLGIGGALLANWMAKREDPNAPIHWSKWVRAAALASSMLIALPSILGAISVAITFFASLTGPGAGSDMAITMQDSLGATTAHAGAAGGVSTALSHLISCGIGILPVGIASLFGGNTQKKENATVSSPPTPRVEKSGIVADVGDNAPLRAGEDGMLNIKLSDSTGRPLTDLQPEMGAMAHLIGISEDRQDFIHCHPIAQTAEGMQFHVRAEREGMTRFFLQLKRNGEEVVLPLDIRIAPPAKFTSREDARPISSHQHALA